MAKRGLKHGASGRITSGIQRGQLVLRTIDFVHRQLPRWRDDPDRPTEQAEEKLNSQLSKFLNARAREQFPMVCFHHEEFQAEHRRVDISALPSESRVVGVRQYTIYDPFLVLEGKRLPAPSADRELEYVTGREKRTGGIQRFKLGAHGATLDVAVMVGYVQERSIPEWHQRINSWIADLASGKPTDESAWSSSETLGPLAEDKPKRTARCLSVHVRSSGVGGKTIQLHHLWVEMAAEVN